jgi:serine/threonine protein kinase/tetratricopeptide (TPR) repeat protein
MTATTDPQRWRRISALFDRLIDLEPVARQTLLDAECGDDPDMRAELERMLAADDAASLLDEGVAGVLEREAADDAAPDEEIRDSIGTVLGHWRLERVLGRGGMGTVYAAHRDDRDTLQRAAIKRLHRRWDGSLQAQRFLQERRILAALSHPNLPRLIDHGLDGEQRPWFALELVEGKSLTAWADAHRLDLRERIALFRDVCAGVQHAHEHFVVHRDLKPANILVDDGGHPKVLDFGVAKRMDETQDATRAGAFAGFTPEYAAPEQISGGAISAATDVYALGVILYQLLSGRLPYAIDHGDLRATADTIAMQQAERLEQAITAGTPHEIDARLQQRGTDARAFRRFVKGDLSRIVQTALAKEPRRRYASVLAFSSDLARFLEGRTVSVSGDTFAYRARKFIGRNRWGVAMAVLAGLLLAGGVFGIAMKTRDVQREAARANAEAKRAESETARAKLEVERLANTNEFLRSVFVQASPENSGSPHMTLEQALDNALKQLDAEGDKQPQLHIQFLLAASSSYQAYGDEEKALAAVRKALRIQENQLPDSKEDRGRILANLAWMRMNYEPKQSLAWATEALGLIKSNAPPAGDTGLIEAYSVLASLQYINGNYQDALTTQRLGRQSTLDSGKPEDSVDVITAFSNEALILAALKRYDEAVSVHQKVVELRARSVGADSVATNLERLYLANSLNRAGRKQEALAQFDRALPALERDLGADHEDVQWSKQSHAEVLLSLGRTAEALSALEAAHAYGRNHSYGNRQGQAGHSLIRAYALLGRCKEVQAVADELRRRKIAFPSSRGPPLAGTHCAK